MAKRIKLTPHQKKYINPNAKYWIETLLPNELCKTTGTLEDSNGFCCLGVGILCCQMKTGIEMFTLSNGSYQGGTLEGDYLNVKDWLGLHSVGGSPKDNYIQFKALWELNDLHNYNFTQIAEHLLAYPEVYFNEV